MPPAISGNHGHDATFAVALALVHGFALSRDQAWPIMLEFNARCDPPWSKKDLDHKLDDATKLARHSKPRGYLLGERGPATSPQSKPVVMAFDVDTSEPLPGEADGELVNAGSLIREALAEAEAEQTMDGHMPPVQPTPQASTRREVTSLAFDIETYCVNHSKEGALSPFTGEIRLMSTADVAGNIILRDLKDNPADQELVDMLRGAELVIHQAAFELRFLGVKLGVVLKQVFWYPHSGLDSFPAQGTHP